MLKNPLDSEVPINPQAAPSETDYSPRILVSHWHDRGHGASFHTSHMTVDVATSEKSSANITRSTVSHGTRAGIRGRDHGGFLAPRAHLADSSNHDMTYFNAHLDPPILSLDPARMRFLMFLGHPTVNLIMFPPNKLFKIHPRPYPLKALVLI